MGMSEMPTHFLSFGPGILFLFLQNATAICGPAALLLWGELGPTDRLETRKLKLLATLHVELDYLLVLLK